MEVNKSEVKHFKDMPEIQHFPVEKVSKDDDAYGIRWANLVRKFLETAYSKENPQAEIVSDGVTYKVLRREKVTAFYDTDGNTIFDVENKRLEKEYGYLMKETAVSESEESADAVSDRGEEALASVGDINAKAIAKLESELEKLENVFEKRLAAFCMEYLKDRCREDQAMCEDVLQEHKTLKKCLEYVQGRAKIELKKIAQRYGKTLSGEVCLPVDNDKVFEWAEDYFHLDDKAIEEQKAKEAAERKKKQEEAAKKAKTKQKSAKKENKPNTKKMEGKTAEKPAPKKRTKEMEGQMDMFSMMGL